MSYLSLVVITIILGFATQAYIKSSYSKFSQVSTGRVHTGADVARKMLDDNGLYDVQVRCVQGTLSDHYDPRTRVVNLSQDIYNGRSVAATAVACHECGHAVQHAKGYAPLKIRTALVPVCNFGNGAWIILLIIGIALNWAGLVMLGVFLYGFVVLFQIVTLPVEFDASNRALAYIKAGAGNAYLPDANNTKGCKTVLTAAALTYVAAALTSILQLLYYLQMFSRD